jgi:predicted esterase
MMVRSLVSFSGSRLLWPAVVDRLRDIPVHVVHGRYDRVCHLYQVEASVRALRAVDNSQVHYFITFCTLDLGIGAGAPKR